MSLYFSGMKGGNHIDIQPDHNAATIGEAPESSEVLSELWLWIRRTFLLGLTAYMRSLIICFRFARAFKCTRTSTKRLRLFIPGSLRYMGRFSSKPKCTVDYVRACTRTSPLCSSCSATNVLSTARNAWTESRTESWSLPSRHDDAPAYTDINAYSRHDVVDADADIGVGAVAVSATIAATPTDAVAIASTAWK